MGAFRKIAVGLHEYGSIEYWMSLTVDELLSWIEEINDSIKKQKK